MDGGFLYLFIVSLCVLMQLQCADTVPWSFGCYLYMMTTHQVYKALHRTGSVQERVYNLAVASLASSHAWRCTDTSFRLLVIVITLVNADNMLGGRSYRPALDIYHTCIVTCGRPAGLLAGWLHAEFIAWQHAIIIKSLVYLCIKTRLYH